MNAFAITGLFVSIPSFILGIFTFAKSKKAIHYLWSAFSFSVALWGFGMYKIAGALSVGQSIFWWRVAEIGVILIPVLLVHFVLKFLEHSQKLFLIVFYALTGFFLFLNIFTDYFISEHRIYIAFDNFYYIQNSLFYTLFIVLFIASALFSILKLKQAYPKKDSVVRSQIKYLFWAFLVGFAGGATSFFPVYGIRIYPVWNVAIFVSALMVSYAILRYRLMDIRIIARSVFMYVLVAGFAYGAFYFVTWLYNTLFGSVYSDGAYILGTIIALIFALVFVKLDKVIKTIANKYLFTNLYNYQNAISNLSDNLNNYIDLQKIVSLITDTIIQTMKLNRAGVLLVNQKKKPIHYQIAKVIGFNEKNGISLVQDNFLTKHLEKTQRPLVRDELFFLSRDAQNSKDRESFIQLSNNMEHIEASLCLPLISNRKLIGIIVLGAKVSGDAYTKEDLDLLNTLSKQAGIAVENAILYEETQKFNKRLKTEVEKATAEIQTGKAQVESALEIEKQAHEELQHLNQAKSEFLNLASHQLRTPTSVIKGVASMMKEGSFEGLPKDKKKTFIEGLYEKSLKLEDIINDILNASEMTSAKFKVNPEQSKLEDPEALISEIIKGFEPKLIERQIELNVDIKDKSLPKIFCQKEFLKEALSNLIENAIKYTPSAKSDKYSRDTRETKAQINVSLYKQDDSIVFRVQDNGIGIPKEEIPNLFKKFQRGSNARNMYTDGSGLGLYIVKEIIEGHGGKVWAESEIGKGSNFFASLPINPPKEINIKQVIADQAKIQTNA